MSRIHLIQNSISGLFDDVSSLMILLNTLFKNIDSTKCFYKEFQKTAEPNIETFYMYMPVWLQKLTHQYNQIGSEE